jgi:hypothetical protein
MSVTVDHEPLPAEKLGYRTVGQVLSHLKRDKRLVVHVLIDGEEPDLRHLAAARQVPLKGHTLYVETADPATLALDALDEVEHQLGEADRLKAEAADFLQANQAVKAMEKLSGCFSTWQHAEESLMKTAQLLRIDLATIDVDGRPMLDMLREFTEQLREIKSALERRDFVSLTDILLYETTNTTARWSAALNSMRQTIQSLTPKS